jgi:hypothetical protein
MAAASANERAAADALVSERRSLDAESTNRRREWHARPGLCHRRALGLPAISASGLTTPTFWTVSNLLIERPKERFACDVSAAPLMNYFTLEDIPKAFALFDFRQVGEGRTSNI